ncbi:carbohydrate ABC transporter permease [Paenibacillus radicis (ex Gao et al. 2016)]|uniref:ABC transporter permease n=1 Tax=Paenibacillus radicis (ex Gao et al. 2016) TaxID=1737354 RepID=A0A917HRF7_9BACL|nr:carbohydrate ABC transporter permease [Paenibacillus radicis (ex Gao et al. 2016)]GGG87136.1 ABC transporter permease [Paenibacillus radicis (ex Gao et al. 2016)]
MIKKPLIALVFLFLLVISIVVNLPVITMVLNSFKSNTEIMTSTQVMPQHWTMENYLFVNDKSAFWQQFINSIIVTSLTVVATILIGALAGYAISRFRTRLTGSFSVVLLLLQMFPFVLIMLPLFLAFRSLHLIDTLTGVILIQTSISLPVSVLMFRGFFDSIPGEIEEAAWMDGCNRWSTFTRIVLPISGPGIAAVSIFTILLSWNDYIIPNIFIKKESLMTLPLGLQMFMQQNATQWGGLTAAATLSALPILIFLLFVQKYIAYGAASGSVKG